MTRASTQLIRWDQPIPSEYDRTRPWDRQPCDTDEVWAAFRAYLAMPLPRRVDLLGRLLGCSQAQALQWAEIGAFKQRATLFDNHVHDTFKAEVYTRIDTEVVSYTERHVKLLTRAEEFVANELEKFIATSRSTDTETIKVRELTTMVDSIVKLQRLLHDKSTENVAAQVSNYNLDNLTVEELKQFKLLKEKARENEDSG